MPQVGELKKGTMLDEPVEKTIKHGVFWYHAPEVGIVNGEEKVLLVERLAFHGDTIQIHRRADLDRGDEHGAFLTDEEAKARAALAQIPPPVGSEDEGSEDEAPSLQDRPDDELVDYIMGTGEFDGKKPNADQVVAAAGDDPDLAARLLDAEETAQGDKGPRQGVEAGLTKIIMDKG